MQKRFYNRSSQASMANEKCVLCIPIDKVATVEIAGLMAHFQPERLFPIHDYSAAKQWWGSVSYTFRLFVVSQFI